MSRMRVQHLQCRLYNTVLCCQDSPYLKGAARLTHLSGFRLRLNPWEWTNRSSRGVGHYFKPSFSADC